MWRVREWLLVFSLRRWSYAWRRSRHVAATPVQYPLPWPRLEGDWLPAPPDFYGSMDMAAERAIHPLPGWGTVASGWREQTAADLSPEALDSDVQPDPYLDPIAAEYGSEWDPEDSGPGVPSLAPPGPAQMSMLPDQEQPEVSPGAGDDLRTLADALRGGAGGDLYSLPAPTRLADTADITDARLLADVQADMRAREDGCLAFLAGFASACERVRLDLSASLA